MAEVMLDIGGRSYALACRDGEEAHLRGLARIVDAKANDAIRAMGNMTENRHLLVVSLLLADSFNDLQKSAGGASPPLAAASGGGDAEAEAIERIAERMEKLALALENGDGNA